MGAGGGTTAILEMLEFRNLSSPSIKIKFWDMVSSDADVVCEWDYGQMLKLAATVKLSFFCLLRLPFCNS